jgi:hypothetical protein
MFGEIVAFPSHPGAWTGSAIDGTLLVDLPSGNHGACATKPLNPSVNSPRRHSAREGLNRTYGLNQSRAYMRVRLGVRTGHDRLLGLINGLEAIELDLVFS